MRRTRDLPHRRIAARCAVRLNDDEEARLPNALNLGFRGVRSDDLIAALADAVAVSAGSACHSGTVTVSPVVRAQGVPREWAEGTIRFSTGRRTTDAEVKRAADAVALAFAALRGGRGRGIVVTALRFESGNPTRLAGIGKRRVAFGERINVLLGPNGYGNSTILRTLAGATRTCAPPVRSERYRSPQSHEAAHNALSPVVASGLRHVGHDVVHVRDIGMQEADDEIILLLAKDEERIIVSAETDFGALLSLRRKSRPSFVLMRRSDRDRPEEIADLLAGLLPAWLRIWPRGPSRQSRTTESGYGRCRSLPDLAGPGRSYMPAATPFGNGRANGGSRG